MKKAFTIFLFLLLANKFCFSQANKSNCSSIIDTLTGMVVYTTADKLPSNEGGKNLLRSRLFKEVNYSEITPENGDYNIIVEVAFIVNNNGNVIGERVINRKYAGIANAMFKIIKQYKWTPAICDGNNVSMIDSLSIKLCLAEE